MALGGLFYKNLALDPVLVLSLLDIVMDTYD